MDYNRLKYSNIIILFLTFITKIYNLMWFKISYNL